MNKCLFYNIIYVTREVRKQINTSKALCKSKYCILLYKKAVTLVLHRTLDMLFGQEKMLMTETLFKLVCNLLKIKRTSTIRLNIKYLKHAYLQEQITYG